MNKPLTTEAYNDDGSFSHWRLIDVDTGDLLWSEDMEEEIAGGYAGLKNVYVIGAGVDHMPSAVKASFGAFAAYIEESGCTARPTPPIKEAFELCEQKMKCKEIHIEGTHSLKKNKGKSPNKYHR